MITPECAALAAAGLVALAVAVMVGYYLYVTGYRHGQDAGWIARQEKIWEDERARRDRAGRFTFKKPGAVQ